MAGDIRFPPLVGWRSLAKGILGASLLVGGLANNWGIIQVLLIIVGLAILVDGVMVTGKGVFIVVCMIAAVIAGAFTVAVSLTILSIPYIILVLIASLIIYYGTIRRLIEKARGKEKP